MRLCDTIIHKADVHRTIPDRYRNKSGVVEAICPFSSHAFQRRLLIGYTKGLIVLWSLDSNCLEQMYIYNQQIECLCWYGSVTETEAGKFASCHSDGSYILWRTDNDTDPQIQNRMPYGPYPCRAINRIIVKESAQSDGDVLVIFSGGLPRSSFPNKSCVSISVYNEKKQVTDELVAFDLSSRFIDMLVVDGISLSQNEGGEITDISPSPTAQALFILTEQELLAIDLESNCPFRLPYLNSIHFSPVSVMGTAQVSTFLAERLSVLDMVGNNNNNCLYYSDRMWPMFGGQLRSEIVSSDQCKLTLVTGHVDGCLSVWDLSDTSFPLLFRLPSEQYFESTDNDCYQNEETELEDNWPPFRRVGVFDDRVGLPTLRIERICVENRGFHITISNTAGYLIVFELDDLRSVNSTEQTVTTDEVTIDLSDRKYSHMCNRPNNDITLKRPLKMQCGFKPIAAIRLRPATIKISALRSLADAGILVIGTNVGFAIFDYIQNKCLVQRVTSSPNLSANLTTEIMSTQQGTSFVRGKSLKKSLRESFRRLRRNKLPSSFRLASNGSNLPPLLQTNTCFPNSAGVLPVERQVESREFRRQETGSMNGVTAVYACCPNVISNNESDDISVMIGTYNGSIFAYNLQLPAMRSARATGEVVCAIIKEIHLRHRAPVMAMACVDNEGFQISTKFDWTKRGASALPSRFDPNPASRLPPVSPQRYSSLNSQRSSRGPQMSLGIHCGNHKLVICTEEQIKIFDLAHMRQFMKYKLTAIDGSIIRKAFFSESLCHLDIKPYISCLTSNGIILIFSLPYLRNMASIRCTRPQDIFGITHFSFVAERNRALMLTSPGEVCELAICSDDTGYRNSAHISIQFNDQISLASRSSSDYKSDDTCHDRHKCIEVGEEEFDGSQRSSDVVHSILDDNHIADRQSV